MKEKCQRNKVPECVDVLRGEKREDRRMECAQGNADDYGIDDKNKEACRQCVDADFFVGMQWYGQSVPERTEGVAESA